jgi:hypothetical protein
MGPSTSTVTKAATITLADIPLTSEVRGDVPG